MVGFTGAPGREGRSPQHVTRPGPRLDICGTIHITQHVYDSPWSGARLGLRYGPLGAHRHVRLGHLSVLEIEGFGKRLKEFPGLGVEVLGYLDVYGHELIADLAAEFGAKTL